MRALIAAMLRDVVDHARRRSSGKGAEAGAGPSSWRPEPSSLGAGANVHLQRHTLKESEKPGQFRVPAELLFPPRKPDDPAVHLEPQMALHLALVLHELGTNSAKYGALSAASGRVDIGWIVEDGVLRLRWRAR